MIHQVSAVAFGRNNAQSTLFTRQHQVYEYHALEPLTSNDVKEKKKHTAALVTLGGVLLATGAYALLGKMHANGTLAEIKDPGSIIEHTKAYLHKIGKSSNSLGKTIKGWFKK